MIEQFLQNHSRGMEAFVLSRSAAAFAPHLDEDALAAFTEGRLTQTEAAPLVSHLIACAMCRYELAGLLRLENEFDFAETPERAETSFDESSDAPNRIRRLLNQLAARLAPFTDEQTVFAYQEETEVKDAENSEEHITQ